MGANATTEPNVVRGSSLLKGQETDFAMRCGPQGTTGKLTNNRSASLRTLVRCSAPQQRGGKIPISSFRKAGETPPHPIREEKGCIPTNKLNGPVMLLGAEDDDHGVTCICANEVPSLQRGAWSTFITMQ